MSLKETKTNFHKYTRKHDSRFTQLFFFFLLFLKEDIKLKIKQRMYGNLVDTQHSIKTVPKSALMRVLTRFV